MTEREKIIKIIAPYVSSYGEDEAIADALIEAEIGDTKETERRTKVAERAVYNMAYGQWQREGAGV